MRPQFKVALTRGVLWSALALTILSSASATTYSWNTTTATWYSAGCWYPQSVPGETDWALIENGGTAQLIVAGEAQLAYLKIAVANNTSGTVQLSAGSLTASRVTVGYSGGSGSGTFDLSSEGTLVLSADLLVSVTGTFNQSGGTATIDEDLILNGPYNLEGGEVETSELYVDNYGEFNLSGGELSATDEYVGHTSGTGTFTQMPEPMPSPEHFTSGPRPPLPASTTFPAAHCPQGTRTWISARPATAR